jgi:hypothetical protein
LRVLGESCGAHEQLAEAIMRRPLGVFTRATAISQIRRIACAIRDERISEKSLTSTECNNAGP